MSFLRKPDPRPAKFLQNPRRRFSFPRAGLVGIFSVLLVGTGAAAFSSAIQTRFPFFQAAEAQEGVVGSEGTNPVLSELSPELFFNVPATFRQLLTAAVLAIEGDATFGGSMQVNGPAEFFQDVVVDGKLTLRQNITGQDIDIDLNSGRVIASNLVYSVTAGSGISVSGDQDLVVSNTDKGSDQKIFKRITIGETTLSADSNDDEVKFRAGTGISLSVQGDEITIAGAQDSGWHKHSSGTVALVTPSDKVGIGTSSPSNTLEISSGVNGLSGLTFTNLTSGSDAGVGGGKVLTVDSGGRIILVQDQTGDGVPELEDLLPTASTGGTLYFNGVNWVSSTNLFHNGGSVGISTDNPLGRLHVMSNALDTIGLIVQGTADQTANLQEWRNGDGNILAYINSAGLFTGSFSGDLDGNITGTIDPGFSTGAIVFQGASALDQDTSLFWDNSTKRLGLGDVTPAALLTVGNGDLFQVNSSGAIAAATGITSSGTINFSELGTGIVTASSGVLSSASTIGADYITADSLDFSELKDAMALDANTSLTAGNAYTLNLISDLISGNRTAPLLSLTQDNNATYGQTSNNGPLLFISNADTSSTVSSVRISQASTGTALSISANTSGSTNGSIYLQNVTSGVGIRFPGEALTTGSVLRMDTGGAIVGNGTFSGSLISYAGSKNVTSSNTTYNESGRFINFQRELGTAAATSVVNISGTMINIESNCNTSFAVGTCNDTSKLFVLAQKYSSATGNVFELTNAGSGNALEVLGAGNRSINSTEGNLTLKTTTSGDILLSPAGNVGIGDSTPDHKLDVDGNIGMTAGNYLNWGDTSGSSGYGIRDNGGTIQVKNSSGSWADIASGSISSAWSGITAPTANTSTNLGTYTTAFSSSATSANPWSFSANSLTSGFAQTITSTSTGLTTGGLMSLDWSPASATTATGDLFSLNIGANGTIGNIFNIKNNGSSIFSVSQSQIRFGVPTNFAAAGDVAFANNLNLTNPTASYINSYSTLYLQAGDSASNYDLALRTWGTGDLFADIGGNFVLSSADPAMVFKPVTYGDSHFWLGNIEDADGSDDDLFQIGKGSTIGTTPYITMTSSGNVGIGNAAPGSAKLKVTGDFEVTGSCTGCSSDSRLKTNVQTISGSVLSKLLTIKGVTFDWADAEKAASYPGKQYGVIAQDVEAVFPEIVGVDSRGYKFVRYDKLIAPTIEAIREQQVQLVSVDGRLTQFSTTLTKLQMNADGSVTSEGVDPRIAELEARIALLEGDLSTLRSTQTAQLGRSGSIPGVSTWVNGVWTFVGNVTVAGTAQFQKAVAFADDVVFAGRLTYEDPDTAGIVVFEEGEFEARIEFEKAYEHRPIIMMTAQNYPGQYELRDVSQEGFSILLTPPATQSATIYWNVIQVKQAKETRAKPASQTVKVREEGLTLPSPSPPVLPTPVPISTASGGLQP